MIKSHDSKIASFKFQDWKKSKYAYAISAMKTNIGMTKDCIDSLLRVNDIICKYFSYMNGSETSFVIGKEADMSN